MNYRLIVLTHGDAPTLELALSSFRANVRPAPSSAFLHVDGADSGRAHALIRRDPWPWMMEEPCWPEGFCRACEAGWRYAAADAGHDYVFWLEHDFVFTRLVDLEELARTLAGDRLLAQVALPRQAVNAEEEEAGGLVARYAALGAMEEVGSFDGRSWLEHSAYWTTNPSLFRRELAAEQPWPAGPECEGKLGIQLRDAGYRFAVWGELTDDPWVQHVGVRSGHGY